MLNSLDQNICLLRNIEMDLDFHVRVCTSKKRVTGKQPLVEVGVANKRASSALSK